MHLLRNINIIACSTNTLATSTRVSHYIDMRGYEGCLFVAVGCSGSKSATGCFLSVQGCSSTTLTSFSTYLGSTKLGGAGVLTISAAGTFSSNRAMVVDLYKPLKPYARFLVHNSSHDRMTMLAIQYGPKKPGDTGMLDHKMYGGSYGVRTVAHSTLVVSPTT